MQGEWVLTVSADVAAFVSGIVAVNATQHNNNLDLWVKAPGLNRVTLHTIRTVTYMQATSFIYILGYKQNRTNGTPTQSVVSLCNVQSCRVNAMRTVPRARGTIPNELDLRIQSE